MWACGRVGVWACVYVCVCVGEQTVILYHHELDTHSRTPSDTHTLPLTHTLGEQTVILYHNELEEVPEGLPGPVLSDIWLNANRLTQLPPNFPVCALASALAVCRQPLPSAPLPCVLGANPPLATRRALLMHPRVHKATHSSRSCGTYGGRERESMCGTYGGRGRESMRDAWP